MFDEAFGRGLQGLNIGDFAQAAIVHRNIYHAVSLNSSPISSTSNFISHSWQCNFYLIFIFVGLRLSALDVSALSFVT